MAYLLVLVKDSGSKDVAHPAPGDVIGVFPDDWIFGTKEKDTSVFQIIHVKGATVESLSSYMESDSSMSSDAVKHPWRKNKLDLSALEARPDALRKPDARVDASILEVDAKNVAALTASTVLAEPALNDQVIE